MTTLIVVMVLAALLFIIVVLSWSCRCLQDDVTALAKLKAPTYTPKPREAARTDYVAFLEGLAKAAREHALRANGCTCTICAYLRSHKEEK